MGLGKTVIMLTAIQRMTDHAEVGRVLVVAPRKVAETTWTTEAQKWAHLTSLRVEGALGDCRQRSRVVEGDADVVVISRDSVVWLYEEYGRKLDFPFDMIVIDELTSFKRHTSARFKAMRRLRPKVTRMAGLTGTPTPNGLLDLWGQVATIDGGRHLGFHFTRYRERFFHTVEHNHIVIKAWPKDGAEEEIRGLISDMTLTMRAEDWLELPEMTERDILITLPDVTLEWYRRFEEEKIIELRDRTGDMRRLTAESAAVLATKLSQYANGQVYDEARGVIETHEWKLKALEEIVEESGQPLLVFYQYRHDLERIMRRLADYGPREYRGKEELDAWNRGEIRLLLAHPASTAYGLNMQAGGHRIVWYSTGWNLELYQQANARLHRQGQKEHVTVMRLICRGTIDERMAAALGDKEKGQTAFLNEMKGRIRGGK